MIDGNLIAIYSLVGLLAIWVMLVTMWKAYRISSLRQDLFDLRGELFDLVLASQNFNFRHPAYVRLRETLNGLIRYAHRITFIRLVAILFVYRDQIARQSASEEWQSIVSDVPKPVADELSKIRFQMHLAVACHIFRVPSVIINWLFLAPRRKRVAYIGTNRLTARPKSHADLYRLQLVGAIRELEHQAVEEREQEIAKNKRERALASV